MMPRFTGDTEVVAGLSSFSIVVHMVLACRGGKNSPIFCNLVSEWAFLYSD